MWDIIRSNPQQVGIILLSISIVMTSITLWKLRQVVVLNNNDCNFRHIDLQRRVNEIQFQMAHLSNYLNQKRQESMTAAIKDATENPDKYTSGTFAMIKDEEKP